MEDFLSNVSGANRLPPSEREQQEEDDDADAPDHPQPVRRRAESIDALARTQADLDVTVAATIAPGGKQKSEARQAQESVSSLSRQKIGSIHLASALASRVAESVRGSLCFHFTALPKAISAYPPVNILKLGR